MQNVTINFQLVSRYCLLCVSARTFMLHNIFFAALASHCIISRNLWFAHGAEKMENSNGNDNSFRNETCAMNGGGEGVRGGVSASHRNERQRARASKWMEKHAPNGTEDYGSNGSKVFAPPLRTTAGASDAQPKEILCGQFIYKLLTSSFYRIHYRWCALPLDPNNLWSGNCRLTSRVYRVAHFARIRSAAAAPCAISISCHSALSFDRILYAIF